MNITIENNPTYFCPVEREPLIEAVTLIKCSHKLNESVAKRMFGEINSNGTCYNRGKCPVCRAVVESYSTDHTFRELVRNALNPASVTKKEVEPREQLIARLENEIKEGNFDAYVDLGLFYKSEKKYTDAFNTFMKAVMEVQNPYAMLQLALLYQQGLGVGRDYETANEYYAKAADSFENGALLHDPQAMYQLALLYESGKGVFKDSLEEAHRLCSEAANLGCQEAKKYLPGLTDKLKHENQEINEKAKKSNEHEYNLKRARLCYQKIKSKSRLTRIEAMMSLAEMYKKGQGVIQSYQKAYHWYMQASIDSFAFSSDKERCVLELKDLAPLKEKEIIEKGECFLMDDPLLMAQSSYCSVM